ncbi:MAG: hypothetical protein PHW18_00295 [Sulfuricurvum sp.]|uniref:hypothetical protein n=1 Tax=Sulfuricurvum sp. TaxID=2025608 RepID=UPI002602AA5F|nr:hypothetical protein [Sulfuricurvum sp.]MDD2827994.1 hypothetical protein [Sulfuricurvum sp.]MDD4948129.1 hypothetical protein [Sulfuricurvum sp.]
MALILYLHILAACAWIGGSIVLFGLGLFIKDKSVQHTVYSVIGPFYGYFETVWLVILIATGLTLANHYNLLAMVGKSENDLSTLITLKIILVIFLSVVTLIHLFIAFTTHTKNRTYSQNLLSRGSSLAIFLLNLLILWVAMNIRTLL